MFMKGKVYRACWTDGKIAGYQKVKGNDGAKNRDKS